MLPDTCGGIVGRIARGPTRRDLHIERNQLGQACGRDRLEEVRRRVHRGRPDQSRSALCPDVPIDPRPAHLAGQVDLVLVAADVGDGDMDGAGAHVVDQLGRTRSQETRDRFSDGEVEGVTGRIDQIGCAPVDLHVDLRITHVPNEQASLQVAADDHAAREVGENAP